MFRSKILEISRVKQGLNQVLGKVITFCLQTNGQTVTKNCKRKQIDSLILGKKRNICKGRGYRNEGVDYNPEYSLFKGFFSYF